MTQEKFLSLVEQCKDYASIHPEHLIICKEEIVVKEKTSGGIYIPDSTKESPEFLKSLMSIGYIVKFSDTKIDDDEINYRLSMYMVGDYIRFNPNCPYRFLTENSEELYLINIKDVLMKNKDKAISV